MARLFYILFMVAIVSIFIMSASLLDLVGWQFTDDSGPFITRMHPATYLIVLTTIIAAIAFPNKVLRAISQPFFIFYSVAVLILFGRAIVAMLSGVTGGELTTVATNFFTPALFYICSRCVTGDDLRKLEIPMRGFLVVNSLMALGERVAGQRFIPGFLDKTTDPRSAALVGHPLNGSMLTGLMLVYLVSARRTDSPITRRFPEIMLHAAAMFAFGGRAALVFTPVLLLFTAVIGGRKEGETNITWQQRALPIALVVIGLSMIFMPIDFVDSTLDRFTQDNNSAATRNVAVELLLTVPTHNLLFGMNIIDRVAITTYYGSPAGLELAWASLTLTFGLLAILPMMIGLPWFLWNITKGLDRSARFMLFLFLVVTAGSLSFGVKSSLIVQFMLMTMILSQRKLANSGAALFTNFSRSLEQERRPRSRERNPAT